MVDCVVTFFYVSLIKTNIMTNKLQNPWQLRKFNYKLGTLEIVSCNRNEDNGYHQLTGKLTIKFGDNWDILQMFYRASHNEIKVAKFSPFIVTAAFSF